jgi:positive regulator of sigma E activity
MTATGTVTRAPVDGQVEIELTAAAGCPGCEGVCTWRRLHSAGRMTFATTLALSVGDPVVVSLPERYVLVGALLAYGLPLVALLLGALAGVAVTGGDAGAALGAALAVVGALAAAAAWRRRVETSMLRRVAVLRAAERHAHTHSL